MHIHILGICGTFMGGVALLARALGHEVSGQDTHVYPPMSIQLQQAGICLSEGFKPEDIPSSADLIVVGNALSRGNPAVEYVLNQGLAYTSGPQWLSEHILRAENVAGSDKGCWVLAVAGTHGKTTTASMLAWILEYAGMSPGFLIGGIPNNFSVSARAGNTPFFVVEADEYDTAFFDKRSKFVHYQPRTLILNNLEFDHADIFPDLAAIQRQFHHLIRTVPSKGLVLALANDAALDDVIDMGCWTPVLRFDIENTSADYSARNVTPDGSSFDVYQGDDSHGRVEWSQIGMHNVRNALAALGAARHVGVSLSHGIAALAEFQGVKRRMEVLGTVAGVTIYDDFAHHPTAVASTLKGLRNRVGDAHIIAILEPVSNTMRMGVHRDALADSLRDAEQVLLYQSPGLDWDIKMVSDALGSGAQVFNNIDTIVEQVVDQVQSGTHILIMSNGAFDGIHQQLLHALQTKESETGVRSQT